MNYYILVVSESGGPKGGTASVWEVAQKRLSAGIWPLYARTRHLQSIKAGDLCTFYVAGSGQNSRCFIGTAVVSKVEPVRKRWFDPPNLSVRPVYASEYDELLGGSAAAKLVHLDEQEVWDRVVPIAEVLDQLVFIRNKARWGQCLQGGCKAITKADFELLGEAARGSRVAPTQK